MKGEYPFFLSLSFAGCALVLAMWRPMLAKSLLGAAFVGIAAFNAVVTSRTPGFYGYLALNATTSVHREALVRMALPHPVFFAFAIAVYEALTAMLIWSHGWKSALGLTLGVVWSLAVWPLGSLMWPALLVGVACLRVLEFQFEERVRAHAARRTALAPR